MNNYSPMMSLYHFIHIHLIFQAYKQTLYGKKYVWFIIGRYPDNWYRVKNNRHIWTVDQLKEGLKGLFITESTILHQEPRLTKVGMVVSRVEEMGFWKIDFRHWVYFRSVR